jgi:hypothetical protein
MTGGCAWLDGSANGWTQLRVEQLLGENHITVWVDGRSCERGSSGVGMERGMSIKEGAAPRALKRAYPVHIIC